MASTHRQEQVDERFARHLRESRQEGIGLGESPIAATQLRVISHTIINGSAEYPPGFHNTFDDPLSFPNDYDNFDHLDTWDSSEPTWLHVPTFGVYMVTAASQWNAAADDSSEMITRAAVTVSNSGTSLDPPSMWGFWSTVGLLGDVDEGLAVFREYAYSGLALLRPTQWLQFDISAGAVSGVDSAAAHDGRLGLALLYEM